MDRTKSELICGMKIILPKNQFKKLEESSNDPDETNPDVFFEDDPDDKSKKHFVLSFNKRAFSFEVEITD